MRKKKKKRPVSKTSKTVKDVLTKGEMLDRIPEDVEYLTTKQLQHVCNDCHRGTIYRYVKKGLITPVRAYGMASMYSVESVRAMIEKMFSPKPR